MSKQVIEYGGEAVGVVVPDQDRLKFLAVKYHVWDLDAQRFRSVDEARAALAGSFPPRAGGTSPIGRPALPPRDVRTVPGQEILFQDKKFSGARQ